MVVESSIRPASSTSPRPSQRKPLPPASPKPKPVSVDGEGGGGPIRNPPCPLFDLVQYSCQPHFNYSPTTGERLKGGSVTCYPLPRVFRKCPGMPAIDVSRKIVENDGVLPLNEPLPKGQPWSQVKPRKTDPFKLNE